MVAVAHKFESDGFVVIGEILDQQSLLALEAKCESEIQAKIGTRNLLRCDWVNELAQKIIQHKAIQSLLPKNSVTVQCNYFSKDTESNWSVSLHRDLSIPVKSKISSNKWTGWSRKEGTFYAQPPKQVLSNIVAVRLHLEDNNSENGALEVVAGSHNDFNNNNKPTLSLVPTGGALVMKPLLLHSSKKLKSAKRRVLHFVFGPEKLPNDAEWANAL